MDALIAGGGPAGSAVAIRLARAGCEVRLYERSQGPRDMVCGGFLGWDALRLLRQLGVEPATLGAPPITRLRLVGNGRTIEAALPAAAAGLSRRALDEALLLRAGQAGAEIRRGVAIREADGAALRLADGRTDQAGTLFLATGKHDLRGLARPKAEAPAAGLRTSLDASPALRAALDGVIELHLLDGGYAGLLLQEDGRANLCLSIDPARLAAAGGTGPALIAALAGEAPLLAERAQGAGGWAAVAGVPYGWRAGATRPGVYRVGDQAAVIASLAGDGVAIALSSGIAAADHWLEAGADGAESYQRSFSARAARPLEVASAARKVGEDRFARGPALAAMRLWPGLATLVARYSRIA